MRAVSPNSVNQHMDQKQVKVGSDDHRDEADHQVKAKLMDRDITFNGNGDVIMAANQNSTINQTDNGSQGDPHSS